MQKIREAGF